MRQVSVIILLTIGCSNPKSTTEQSIYETSNQSTRQTEVSMTDELKIQRTFTDELEIQGTLTDTVLNGFSTKFNELTAQTFDSLLRQGKRTEIILKSANHFVKKRDSCFVIKFDNHKTDSLCNKNNGDYYEKYLVKGLWELNNLILVNFENWEDNHDFFINLSDGVFYILTPTYEVNPNHDKILTYVDITTAPIYSSELMVSKIQNGIFTTLYKKELGKTTITDATWISNSDCLLTTGFVDNETNDVQDKRWFRMTIEQDSTF